MDGAAVEAAPQLITGVTEDRHHVRVLGEHLGLETFETALGGGTGQVLQQNRAQSTALVLIRDHEGDLRSARLAVGREPLVDADRDDLPTQHADKGHPAVVIDGRHPGKFAGRDVRARTEISRVAVPLRQPGVEADETFGVLGNDRAKVNHPAVVGQDIGDPIADSRRGPRLSGAIRSVTGILRVETAQRVDRAAGGHDRGIGAALRGVGDTVHQRSAPVAVPAQVVGRTAVGHGAHRFSP